MSYIWESSPRECEYLKCGKTFTPMRSDARFCSGKCRVASHREKDTLNRKIERLRSEAIDLLLEYSTYGLSEDAVQRLRGIAATIETMADSCEGNRNARTLEQSH